MDEIRGLPPADALARCTLIRIIEDDWETWLEAAGAAGTKPARRLRFPHYQMAVAAAMGGVGIALGYTGFAETEIAAGTLVQPFDLIVPVRKAYYLVYVEERLADARVRAFRDWAPLPAPILLPVPGEPIWRARWLPTAPAGKLPG